jgi:hypothetical protein
MGSCLSTSDAKSTESQSHRNLSSNPSKPPSENHKANGYSYSAHKPTRKIDKLESPDTQQSIDETSSNPTAGDDFNLTHQNVLLLHGPKQKYVHTNGHEIARLNNDREMLVKVDVVGLNPIDWKAPHVTMDYSSE